MEPAELRARRKALKMTQAELAEAVGLSRDYVGLMERVPGKIEPRTAAAVRALKPAPLDRTPELQDPLEREIESALIDAGIRYLTDQGGGTDNRLDFYLPDFRIYIEVKRFYTARTGEQLARAPNVIAAQGEAAIRFLAAAIRSGDFIETAIAAARFKTKGQIHELCPNCGERQAELIGDYIHLAHRCPKTGIRTTSKVSLDDADWAPTHQRSERL